MNVTCNRCIQYLTMYFLCVATYYIFNLYSFFSFFFPPHPPPKKKIIAWSCAVHRSCAVARP